MRFLKKTFKVAQIDGIQWDHLVDIGQAMVGSGWNSSVSGSQARVDGGQVVVGNRAGNMVAGGVGDRAGNMVASGVGDWAGNMVAGSVGNRAGNMMTSAVDSQGISFGLTLGNMESGKSIDIRADNVAGSCAVGYWAGNMVGSAVRNRVG